MSNEQVIKILVKKTRVFGQYRYIPDCKLSKTMAAVSKVKTFMGWQLKVMQAGGIEVVIEQDGNAEIE